MQGWIDSQRIAAAGARVTALCDVDATPLDLSVSAERRDLTHEILRARDADADLLEVGDQGAIDIRTADHQDVGRLHPVGILLAGLLMALTYIGGELAQTMIGMPAAAIQLFQGMLLFFLLAMDVFANYRIRLGRTEVKA